MGFSLATLSAQSPSPAASPETSPSPAKHRHAKKEASAAVAESPAAASSVPESSPSPAKNKRVKKNKSAATTSQPATAPLAAVSPSPAKHSWFGSKSASPTPAPAPVAATSAAATSAAKTVSAAPAGPIAVGGGPGMVWVNTESHTYHKQGSRWYGRTKKGKYMSSRMPSKKALTRTRERRKRRRSLSALLAGISRSFVACSRFGDISVLREFMVAVAMSG